MPIRDKSIGWKFKRMWIPIRVFQGLDSTTDHLQTVNQGTPTVEPITTSEIVGLPMTTADEIAHILPIPWDLNRDKNVLGRIIFQHAAAGADTPGFIWTSKFFGKQDAMTEFIAGKDVAITLPDHTCSTTNPSLEVTNWVNLDWEDYIVATDVLMAMSIELNALGSSTADECKLLGAEIAYEIEATQGYRARSQHMLADQPV